MSKLQELQEQRNDVADKIRSLGESFQKNGEEWKSANDKKQWAELNHRYDQLSAEMDAERNGGVLDRMNQVNQIQNSPANDRGIGRHDVNNRLSGALGPMFRNMQTGQDIQALLPGDRFANVVRDDQVFDEDASAITAGNVIHSLLTGEPQGMTAEQFNAQIGGSDSGGGYILNPSLTGTIVDLARSASVAMRAGAMTLPMDTREVHVARLTKDPTANWRPEGKEVKASSLAFDRVTLSAKTLAAYVPVSLELIEDASNIASIINNALQAALGLSLDKAVLFGIGSEEEPRGIRNAEGINKISAVGTPTDYSQVSSAVGDILNENYPGDSSGLAWISHPRDGETYDGLTDTTGQPLQPTPWASKLQRLATTSLPTDEGGGNDESVAIIGDFSQVVVGMRTRGATIRVLDQGSITDEDGVTHNATSELKRIIVAYLRADVALLRPSWMSLLEGITAA